MTAPRHAIKVSRAPGFRGPTGSRGRRTGPPWGWTCSARESKAADRRAASPGRAGRRGSSPRSAGRSRSTHSWGSPCTRPMRDPSSAWRRATTAAGSRARAAKTKRLLMSTREDPGGQSSHHLGVVALAGGFAGQCQHVCSHFAEQWLGLAELSKGLDWRQRIKVAAWPSLRSTLVSFPPSAVGFVAFEYGKIIMNDDST
ncbi:hypothetical protein THAOC_11381 [Thalassiosira oceanica]|uniref:Uncharacterized protein n=1 Tax=Thalassiosira oceanica TaxID=159749 RepID=K0T2P9_THAOC|nr:hypothetical protein THAOC_11381 [Thalassiosira oceanica]|eukprot:EJK67566.1 hypothetical protein THAOC_11381 [Thalassiosira oceanica]